MSMSVLNVHVYDAYPCLPCFHAACLCVLLVYAACLILIHVLRVHAACLCCMFVPHVCAACACSMSLLHIMSMRHVHVECPSFCCVSMLTLYDHIHAACPCCMSVLHVCIACQCSMFMSIVHVHVHATCAFLC